MANVWANLLEWILALVELVYTLVVSLFYIANPRSNSEGSQSDASKYTCTKTDISHDDQQQWRHTAKTFDQQRIKQGGSPFVVQLLSCEPLSGEVVWQAVQRDQKNPELRPTLDDNGCIKLPEGLTLKKWYLSKNFDWLQQLDSDTQRINTADVICAYSYNSLLDAFY